MKWFIPHIAGLLLLAYCVVCRLWTPAADFYAVRLYPAISTALSWLGARIPFSLEEIVVLAFIVSFVDILVKAIRHKENFFRWLGKTAVVAMWLYVWFYMGWGNNYYRTGLYARNGIEKVHYDGEAFKAFLEDYSKELNQAAYATVEIDNSKLEDVIRRFYSEKVTPYGYTPLHKWQSIKKPVLNPLFSAVLVHGYMGPFFCESQVNSDLLPHEYPYVAAHEMGHLAGVTSEAEASFWGFACCRESEIAAVRYSGYLAVLPYVLSNAGRLLPEDEFQAWTGTICEKAGKDYTESRAYWSGKRVVWIEKVQNWFYNLYLKSNGVSEGVKDYSGVVSMIMTMDAHMQAEHVANPITARTKTTYSVSLDSERYGNS